jgi:hypothetical protein
MFTTKIKGWDELDGDAVLSVVIFQFAVNSGQFAVTEEWEVVLSVRLEVRLLTNGRTRF